MIKKVMLALGLALFIGNVSAESIKIPQYWGSNFLLGVSNDQANPISLKIPQSEGVGTFYHYRNVSAREIKFDASGNVRSDIGIISQIKNGFIASGNSAGAKPSLMLEYFSGTGEVPDKDALLQKFNNVEQISAYFKIIKALGEALKTESNAVVVIEPDTWSTIMQAKFHFFDSTHSEYKKPYKEILDFPAKVKQTTLGLTNEFSYLNEYPNTVAGLANALVRAVREEFNNPNVGMTVSTWAAFASGCSNGADINKLNNDIFSGQTKVKGVNGIQTWSDDDIKISAFSNVHFYRKMFDTLATDNVFSEETKKESKPDFFGINKSPLDAGYVKHYNEYKDLIAIKGGQTTVEGAGSNVFYWNQGAYDKWLRFSRFFAYGIKLPLVAIKMPVGHIGLNNKAFEYEDTFANWLFGISATSAEEGEFKMNSDNFKKFKEAGFIGLWIGRDGWPAFGTHYGKIESDLYSGGTLTDEGNTSNEDYIKNIWEFDGYFKKDGNTYTPQNTGDGGWLIRKFKGQDRNVGEITINSSVFSDADFDKTTGACSVPAEGATVEDVTFLIDKDGSNSGLYLGASDDDVSSLVQKTGLVTFKVDSSFNLESVLGSNLSEEEKTEILNHYKDYKDAEQGSAAGLNVKINFGPASLDLKNPVTDVASLDMSTFPEFAYRWYIFDTYGQYVNSEVSVINQEDLRNYLVIEDGEVILRLITFFNKRSSDGRKLGSGIYHWKGYIEERDGQSFNEIDEGGNVVGESMRKTENQVISKKIGFIRN